jgi:hypothetical protein
MYCICCKKNNVIPTPKIDNSNDNSPRVPTNSLLSPNEEDIIWKDSKRKDGSLVNVNNEMIDNGIIHIIDAGYGSIHDGDQFVIAICDDCIKENLEDATLLYYGNYMYALEGYVEEEREKSKQKYRRRKNLDNII